jgi:GT2 family glycosyltransferase
MRLPVSAQIRLRDLKIALGAGLAARSALSGGRWIRASAWAEAYRQAVETARVVQSRYPGTYSYWIKKNEPSAADAGRLWSGELGALTGRPLISVLVPTYETPAALLQAMIDSVRAQVYPNWELCIADDASKAPHVRAIIEQAMAGDPRIKAVFRPVNGHISEASNSALDLATGDWLALLDHDDLLTPNALLEVAKEIEAHPDAAFIYSDEDKLDARGGRYEPFFKPDFSPELLRAQNYLNHLSVHRTEAVRAVGGWRKGFEGSQDYDLNLRTLETIDPARVRHIPKVLYHWRAVEGSTALARGEKDYAFTAGLKALEEHVARLGWDAAVEPVGALPFYRVRYALPAPPPMVSLIIPTRDHADLLATCVDSVLSLTDYPSYEILIVDNGSVEPETFALFKRLTRDPRVRIVAQPGPFNYSRINNQAVAQSRGDIVALLNNDIEVINPDWMTEMAAWAAQPRIGCVGAKLYYPNDTIQHAGVILGIGGVAGHSHKYFPRSDAGYFSRLAISHDVSAVTGACLYVRREIWDALGGLDERLAVAFNDVDFCIRVREAGYTNLFTPFAELYHHESLSRGAEDNPEKVKRFNKEVGLMQKTWGERLSLDPFYSPNLSTTREDYSLL